MNIFKEPDFADSLILIRHLLKENNRLLRKTGGTIPKENLRNAYKCLFQSEFDSSHPGLADLSHALNEVLNRSKLDLTTEQIVNNSNTMTLSTVQEEVKYLDKAHKRLLTFNNRLYGDSVLLKNLQTLVCHFRNSGNCTRRQDHKVSLLCWQIRLRHPKENRHEVRSVA